MEPAHKMLLNSLQYVVDNRKGFSTVFGVFLIHLCAGCYHGTFGNLLPYFTSYLRLVMLYIIYMLKITHHLQSDTELTNGDVAMIFAHGGLAQGISFLIGIV